MSEQFTLILMMTTSLIWW